MRLSTLTSALISSLFFKKDLLKPNYFMPSCYFPSDPIQRKCGRNNHLITKICASSSLAQSYPWEITLHLDRPCHSTHQWVGSEMGCMPLLSQIIKGPLYLLYALSLSLPVCREQCVHRGRQSHKAREAWILRNCTEKTVCQ